MSIAYSTGRIEFTPTDPRKPLREYSERSMIELRKDSENEYSLRALDVENHKAEIFNLPLKGPGMYQIGQTFNIQDEVHCEKGIYRLSLNALSRDGFHQDLHLVFDELADPNRKPLHTQPDKNQPKKLIKIPKEITDQDNILIDINKLRTYIEYGKADKAAKLASKLALKRMQFKPEDTNSDDEEIRIQIKIDGIDISKNETNKLYTLTVYKSTKIDELRALFQHVYEFPAVHQYFFVNGHLAYAESTMDELGVEDNSLFVLFLTANALD